MEMYKAQKYYALSLHWIKQIITSKAETL